MRATKQRMLVIFGMMLAMGCISSNCPDSNETTTYTFAGRPQLQFASSPNRDQTPVDLRTPQTTTDQPGKTERGCPSGYTSYDGTFFKAYNQAKTYSQARHVCEDDGGLLAMPKNQDLDTFLWKLKNSVDSGEYFWFGLSDELGEGEWMWVDWTPYNATSDWGDWQPGQPDDAFGSGEDCVHYVSASGRGWNDLRCDTTLKFICQLTQDEGSRDHASCLMKNADKTVCPDKSDGSDYRGNLSVTRSGKTCQRWDLNFPHAYPYYWWWFDNHSDPPENYCRNPDGELGLWCYTTDPNTRWEYCTNPACLI